MAVQTNRYMSLARLLNRQEPTYGGKNALTAVEKSGANVTDYLRQNQGYAQLVGVQFDGKGKVYDYIDQDGTSRAGDSPTVEITHYKSGRNQFVPSEHTKIVETGKGGIAKNAEKLDRLTDKGINLKTIQRQSALRSLSNVRPMKTQGGNTINNNKKGGM